MESASAPSSRTEAAQRTAPLINRGFALLWSGQVVTDLGTVVFNTALIIWIAAALAHGQPWAPLAVSGLLLAQSLPMLLVRPLAGVFVDRWDSRRTMLRMDALRAALVALAGRSNYASALDRLAAHCNLRRRAAR